jgi:hypothetical protein
MEHGAMTAAMTVSDVMDRIADARDLIRRFTLTAELGNPASIRIVDEARQALAVAEKELADLEFHQD